MRLRSPEAFLQRIADALPPKAGAPEPAARAVFRLLARHISAGEMRDVRQMLPDELGDMFPEEAPRQP